MFLIKNFMNLTDAGTSFESGVRRSKRMKTRPLEYWKGERLLYGRVNEGEHFLVNSLLSLLCRVLFSFFSLDSFGRLG